MSYIPEDQELVNRLEKHLETGKELEAAMWARIEAPDGWTADHIAELFEFTKDLSDWRMRLLKFQKGR